MAYVDVKAWQGSLVSALSQEATIPGDFTVLKNFIYDSAGFPVVRGGRRIWNDAVLHDPQDGGVLATISGLYHFKKGWLTGRLGHWLICYAGRRLYKADHDGHFDELFAGFEKDLEPSFATLRGWVVFATNSEKIEKPIAWNGATSTASVLKNCPDGSIVAAHAGRLWVVDRNEPSKLNFSAAFEPDGWGDGAGWLYVNPGDGNSISALVPSYGGEMIVFKDGPSGGATYRLQGLTPDPQFGGFSVTPLSETIGAISQRSTCLIGDNDIYFGSRRGLHSLRRTFEHGDLESAFIDNEVSDIWRSLSLAQKKRAVGVDDFQNDTYWLFYDRDNDGLNDNGLLLNYRRKTVRGFPSASSVDFGANAACVSDDRKSGKSSLITGSQGFVHTNGHPEAEDFGTPIAWSADIAPINAGDPFSVKAWQQVWMSYDCWGESTVDCQWWCDGHWPSSGSLALNQSNLPVPFTGGFRLGETRTVPIGDLTWSVLHTAEGGASFSMRLSGSRGRLRMRSMRILYAPGAMNATLPRWMPDHSIIRGGH